MQADVAKMCEAVRTGMSESFHDIAAHVAAELEFASYLIAEQLKNDEHGSSPAEQLPYLEKNF